MSEDIRAFVDSAVRENAARRDEAMKAKGLNPYLELVAGINEFTLLPFKPSVRTSSFGKDQYVFKTEKAGKQYDYTVTKNSPFAIEIIKKLPEAPVLLKVMKFGEGKATRYQLL